MTRQVCYVFFGSPRGSQHEEAHVAGSPGLGKLEPPQIGCHEAHESPPVMIIPLVVLAAFSMLLGFIGSPAWPWFQGFLDGGP